MANATAWRVSEISWTRRICTPSLRPASATASEPANRLSASGSPPTRPIKRLRDAPSKQRAAKTMEKRNPGNQCQIVGRCLSESDAGIENHPITGNSMFFGRYEPFFKKIIDIEQHIIIGRAVLHGLGVALGVHQADRHIRTRGDGGHIGVIGESRDIIQKSGARGERGLGHRGLARIDRNRSCVGRRERPDHGFSAGDFVFGGHEIGTGTR